MKDQIETLREKQQQILEELKNCADEISGQQLHRALIDNSLNMGLTTVYRNLRTLQQKGLVRCRNLPTGEALYSPVNRDNHHLTCVDCGKTLVLKTCPIKNIELPKNQTKDFELLFHTLEFFGICRNCNQRQQVA
tara:strand:+ start:43 stop:447 length:405 start_codon:yes stop_codon:yes gene_type:complete